MNTSAKATDKRVADVLCTEESLVVHLMDGSTISVPLDWLLGLMAASVEQLTN